MTRGVKLPFFDYTRADLKKRLQIAREINAPDYSTRLQIVIKNNTPKETDIRHWFYDLRVGFLKEHIDYPSVTYGSDCETFYVQWSSALINFCTYHCKEFGIPKSRWWLIRDLMNIHPEARATCQSENGDFMIDWLTRGKVAVGSSFIVVCEKKTVSRELCKALRDRGYKVTFISSGGKTPADVTEAVTQAMEGLEKQNYYVLFLHDFDLAGVQMIYTLRESCPNVIDVGVNRVFLKTLGEIDPRLCEEQVLNKDFFGKLECQICGIKCPQNNDHKDYTPENCEAVRGSKYLQPAEYSQEDFRYLQGEPHQVIKCNKKGEVVINKKGETTIKTEYSGKRIEIDAIHVQYGIQPFVDYIESRLADIHYWDLTRINIGEQSLREPNSKYDEAIIEKENEVYNAYHDKEKNLSENLNKILDTVRSTLTMPPEYSALKQKYFENGTIYGKLKPIDPLKEEYKEQIDREWVDDYQDDLDEINDKLDCYDGKLATARKDIEDAVKDLQDQLEEDKANDEDLAGFREKLGKIDWGEKELEKIQIPDPVEEMRKVIVALQDCIAEIEKLKP